MSPCPDRAPVAGVEGLDGVGNRYEDFGVTSPAGSQQALRRAHPRPRQQPPLPRPRPRTRNPSPAAPPPLRSSRPIRLRQIIARDDSETAAISRLPDTGTLRPPAWERRPSRDELHAAREAVRAASARHRDDAYQHALHHEHHRDLGRGR